MKNYYVLWVLSVCSVILLTTNASADLIAYEGFDMVNINEGAGISGFAGVTSFGFSEPFRSTTPGTPPTTYNAPRFVNNSLVADGISIMTRGGSILESITGGNTRVLRNLSQTLGATDGTYYMSLLFSSAQELTFDLSDGDWNTNRRCTIGREWSSGNIRLVGYEGGAEVYSQEIASANEVHFYVLKFVLGTDTDTISIFVDPDIYASEPAVANASFTVTAFSVDRIRHSCFNTANTGLLDEIRLGTTYADVTPANGAAYNVAPLDGELGVLINSLLQWHIGADPNEFDEVSEDWAAVKGFNVYFGQEDTHGDDPNLFLVTPTALPVTTTSFDPAISKDITYYWQIEEVLDNGQGGVYGAGDPNNMLSLIWSFQTELTMPVITSQPQYTLVGTGDTAVFTVGVESETTPTFKWYYSPDNANNTPTGDVLQSSTSETLSILNVAQSNEGYYYCVVSNESLVEVASSTAFLEFKRLKAWYPLEANFDDQVNEDAGYDGGAGYGAPLPTYILGKVGNAASMSGTAAAATTALPIKRSFTIALWLKTTAINSGTTYWYNGLGIVDSYLNPGTANSFGTSMLNNKFSLGIGGSPAAATISSTTSINDGQWHYCVATRDYLTGAMKIYIDGTLETTGTGTTGIKDAGAVLRIGKLRTGTSYLAGTYDEIKMYNYVLTHEEIAAALYSITGTPFCLTDIPYDSNDDCVVDLADFVVFASNWLDCTLYPQSECGN